MLSTRFSGRLVTENFDIQKRTSGRRWPFGDKAYGARL
jgi:hypothetical protein